MNFIYSVTFFFMASLVIAANIHAGALKDEFMCGIALGYPPYQFTNEAGEPTGLDVDILRLVFEKMGKKLIIRQDEWDNVVANLCYGDLDCVGGMEVNETRKSCLDFTTPYYNREISVFLLAKSTGIRHIDDLKWKTITGDRHSFVEQILKEQGLEKKIRILQTKSKDESIRLLKKGVVSAMIAPKAVGLYLAEKHKIAVRILDASDPGSPVSIAVKKGNDELRNRLDAALSELRREGALDAIFEKWHIQ